MCVVYRSLDVESFCRGAQCFISVRVWAVGPLIEGGHQVGRWGLAPLYTPSPAGRRGRAFGRRKYEGGPRKPAGALWGAEGEGGILPRAMSVAPACHPPRPSRGSPPAASACCPAPWGRTRLPRDGPSSSPPRRSLSARGAHFECSGVVQWPLNGRQSSDGGQRA